MILGRLVGRDFQTDDLAENAEGDLLEVAFDWKRSLGNYFRNHVVSVGEMVQVGEVVIRKVVELFLEKLLEKGDDAREHGVAVAEEKPVHAKNFLVLFLEQNVLLVKLCLKSKRA